MGGRLFWDYVGSSPVYGGLLQEFTFASTQSTVDQLRTFTFLGGLPSSIPAFIHGPGRTLPSHGGSPHAPASVASTLALAAPPLRPLSPEDLSGSSSSNLTMSFWPATPVVAPPGVAVPTPGLVPGSPQAAAAPEVAVHSTGLFPGVSPPAPMVAATVLTVPVLVVTPPVGVDATLPARLAALAPSPIPMLHPVEPFKLPPIPDTKTFLNLSSILQYYLWCPEFLPIVLMESLSQTLTMRRRELTGKVSCGLPFRRAP